MKAAKTPNLSPAAFQELQTCAERIRPWQYAERIWDKSLNQIDRELLGYRDAVEAWRKIGTKGIWSKSRGVSPHRAVCEAGLKLDFLTQSKFEELMREIGESLDGREAMQVAIETNDLVVCEHPAEVHFRGELVKLDWEAAPVLQEYVWLLAKYAKKQLPISADAFNRKSGPLANLKWRLTRRESLFPVELADFIATKKPRGLPERERTTWHQLMLPPNEIRIFVYLPGGAYREWLPCV